MTGVIVPNCICTDINLSLVDPLSYQLRILFMAVLYFLLPDQVAKNAVQQRANETDFLGKLSDLEVDGLSGP